MLPPHTQGLPAIPHPSPNPSRPIVIQNRGGQTFTVKGPILNNFGFVGQTVSVAATQLCRKAVTDNM